MTQRYSNAMRLCAGTALLAMLAGCAISAPTLAPGTSDKAQSPKLNVQTGKEAKDDIAQGATMQGQHGTQPVSQDMSQQSCGGQMQGISDQSSLEGQAPPPDQGVSTQPQLGQQNVSEQAQLPTSQSDVSQGTGQDLSQGQLPASSTALSQEQTSSSVDLGTQRQPPKDQSAPSQQGHEDQPMDQSQMPTSAQCY